MYARKAFRKGGGDMQKIVSVKGCLGVICFLVFFVGCGGTTSSFNECEVPTLDKEEINSSRSISGVISTDANNIVCDDIASVEAIAEDGFSSSADVQDDCSFTLLVQDGYAYSLRFLNSDGDEEGVLVDDEGYLLPVAIDNSNIEFGDIIVEDGIAEIEAGAESFKKEEIATYSCDDFGVEDRGRGLCKNVSRSDEAVEMEDDEGDRKRGNRRPNARNRVLNNERDEDAKEERGRNNRDEEAEENRGRNRSDRDEEAQEERSKGGNNRSDRDEEVEEEKNRGRNRSDRDEEAQEERSRGRNRSKSK